MTNEMREALSKGVIEAAESYVRGLVTDDLSNERTRRRLKLAVVELTRIRQVFAPDEATEMVEIDEGYPDREQLPNEEETSSQRMMREVTSMMGPLVETLGVQNETGKLRAITGRTEAIASISAQIALAEEGGDKPRADLLRRELERLASFGVGAAVHSLESESESTLEPEPAPPEEQP